MIENNKRTRKRQFKVFGVVATIFALFISLVAINPFSVGAAQSFSVDFDTSTEANYAAGDSTAYDDGD